MGEGKDNVASLRGSRRLADAVRAAKISAAHRSDVVVDIREADRARLEILAEEMQPIADELSASDDLFDFTISGGPQPRFWVDGTAHVSMARDRRTYRFVRETRIGRVTLGESVHPREIADRVTAFVAERIVERDKAFAETDGFGLPERRLRRGTDAGVPDAEPIGRFASVLRPPSTDFVLALCWMIIGMVVGSGGLVALTQIYGLSFR